MSAATTEALLRARILSTFDDLLTDFCEELQKFVVLEQATPDAITEALSDAFPFSDEIQDAWHKWLEESGVA